MLFFQSTYNYWYFWKNGDWVYNTGIYLQTCWPSPSPPPPPLSTNIFWNICWDTTCTHTLFIKGCHIQNEMSSSNCSIRNILILRSYGLGKKHHFKQWHLGISNNLSEIIHWFILTVFSWYLYIDKNMGRFLTPSLRKLQLAQIYIGGNSGARGGGGGGGGHMAKRLGDPIIYGDATPPVFSRCPPQLCMLALNNNGLDIHLNCACFITIQ